MTVLGELSAGTGGRPVLGAQGDTTDGPRATVWWRTDRRVVPWESR
ncbi:hypothetical protein JN535_19330 [Cellulosimicrobium cellulans]|nr:hypothetical protein [Cellulosimicrobium cellulans]